MKLEGIHHITAITGDAPRNVDFYAGTWACGWSRRPSTRTTRASTTCSTRTSRAVPAPTSRSSSSAVPRRAAGNGMVHRIVWRVAPRKRSTSGRAVGGAGGDEPRRTASLRFADPEGLDHEWASSTVEDAPLIADHPEIPGELALQGSRRTRVRIESRPVSGCWSALEFDRADDGLGGARRQPRRAWSYDEPPAERGIGAQARCITSRGRRRWTTTRPGARSATRGRPSDAGDRPLLVSVDLLPRAERRPLRDRDARAGLRRRRGPEHLGETLILPPYFEQPASTSRRG